MIINIFRFSFRLSFLLYNVDICLLYLQIPANGFKIFQLGDAKIFTHQKELQRLSPLEYVFEAKLLPSV